jgi:hypothetical protein
MSLLVPTILTSEFHAFFQSVGSVFANDESVYFDGRCTETDIKDYKSWTFCLVNEARSTYLFIPSQIAFFYINVAMTNLSPLPGTLTTNSISAQRMRFLHMKYRPRKLLHVTLFDEVSELGL